MILDPFKGVGRSRGRGWRQVLWRSLREATAVPGGEGRPSGEQGSWVGRRIYWTCPRICHHIPFRLRRFSTSPGSPPSPLASDLSRGSSRLSISRRALVSNEMFTYHKLTAKISCSSIVWTNIRHSTVTNNSLIKIIIETSKEILMDSI